MCLNLLLWVGTAGDPIDTVLLLIRARLLAVCASLALHDVGILVHVVIASTWSWASRLTPSHD